MAAGWTGCGCGRRANDAWVLTPMIFNINPDLDLDKIAQTYAVDARVRINAFLPVGQAKTLSRCLAAHTAYRHAFTLGGKYGEAGDADLQALPEAERHQFKTDILTQAAQGVGFWYERYQVTAADNGLLGDMFNWLNSAPFLDAMAKITGNPSFQNAVAQATRYRPGDFLTRHQDIVTKQKRKVAFVINLPPRWHPDWGGLLQFYKLDGTPRNAWNPDFNSLSLFDVSHVHSVTSISPFAPDPRLAVSGWFQLG